VVETFNVLGDVWNDFVCVWQRVNIEKNIIVHKEIINNIGILEKTINNYGIRTKKMLNLWVFYTFSYFKRPF